MTSAVHYQTYGTNSIVTYREPLPPLGSLLSQGATAGIFTYFMLVLAQLIYHPHPYDLVLGLIMPIILAYGAGLGLTAALGIWALRRVTDARAGWLSRTTIALVGSIFATVGLAVFLNAGFPNENLNELILASLFVALTIGVLTGSRLHPLRAFTRGCRQPSVRQAWPASLIGLAFRTLTVFGLMECVFALITILRDQEYQILSPALLIMTYFVAQTTIAFAVSKSWLLIALGSLINAPWIFLIVRFSAELNYAFYPIVIYLSLWKLFAISQLPMGRLFSFLKEELRYYNLID